MLRWLDFQEGRRFRVVKPDCGLSGLKRIDGGGYRGWGKRLEVGDELTCAGARMTMGDGVQAIKWVASDGTRLVVDCVFRPSTGGMFFEMPEPDCLEPIA